MRPDPLGKRPWERRISEVPSDRHAACKPCTAPLGSRVDMHSFSGSKAAVIGIIPGSTGPSQNRHAVNPTAAAPNGPGCGVPTPSLVHSEVRSINQSINQSFEHPVSLMRLSFALAGDDHVICCEYPFPHRQFRVSCLAFIVVSSLFID